MLAEYSPENSLPADQVFAGTHKKLKWICSICGLKWEAIGKNRVRGHGCPACANQTVVATNNLSVTHPHLLAEYSPENSLPADQVFAGTNKKLKWICSVCGYKWETRGNLRIGGTGCPECARKRRRKT